MSTTPLRITWENLDTEYDPRPGVEYEVADGCVRTLKRPLYDVDKQASVLMARENALSIEPDSDNYGPKIRLQVLEVITTGDKLPKDGKGVDMQIVGRVIADFFTFRIARPGKQSTL